MRRTKGTGFTLIELLIVVAIIAILALIAVPNFLEAQTRAKVSRVKNDMRTLAVAEEAYFVDWNSYTFGQGGADYPVLDLQGLRLLTTPIAYTTSIPMDPFGMSIYPGQGLQMPYYELGVGAVGRGPAGRSFTDSDNVKGMPSNTYEFESDGPDHNDNTGGDGPAPSTGSYPTGWDVEPGRIVNSIYDPTNGTVSVGEIYRPGGLVPPGPALQIFFSMTSSK